MVPIRLRKRATHCLFIIDKGFRNRLSAGSFNFYLKYPWLCDLQILYGKNVVHVNNANDKIDNSEQEQDVGGTAE